MSVDNLCYGDNKKLIHFQSFHRTNETISSKILFSIVLIFISGCLAVSDQQSSLSTDVIQHAVIPYPEKVIAVDEFSTVKEIIYTDKKVPKLLAILDYVKYCIPAIQMTVDLDQNTFIRFDDNLPMEGYELNIESTQVSISCHGTKGLRNAFSTLHQLYVLNDGKFPMVQIEDSPRFGYRGMHLDVCRHFYSVAEVKKYIDYLAFYKFNTFHWHLTEDQGWRIEIKKYPRLHEIGGYRDETLIGHYSDKPHQFDGKKYGGYYTQEQAKDVVAYAASRGIEVIPEIELPGHSLAALSAYPELGCENKDYKAATKWGIFSDVYCPTEKTFEFLESVFDEIIEIFPSPYIHVGGDECPKTAWENSPFCQDIIRRYQLKDEHGLQSYFIQRIEKYLNSKGKMIIGWDEILEGGLAPNATVMSWRGEKGGVEAANANHNVIMTPTTYCYFDYYQSEHPDEPLAIGGLLPYDKVYHYEVIPADLPADKHKFILGGQGNIWTEYIPTFAKLEYMGLTRMAALSETLWKSKSSKDFDRFNKNLLSHIQYWNSKDVNMANHLFDAKAEVHVTPSQGVFISTNSTFASADKYVQQPGDSDFELQQEEIKCEKPGVYTFYHELNGEKGRSVSITYMPHLANKASISLKQPPSKKYGGNGPQSLINGVQGFSDRYGGSEWLGFAGDNLEATIDLQKAEAVRSIQMRFFKGEGQWIYLPSHVLVLGSKDGIDFQPLIEQSSIQGDQKIVDLNLSFDTFTGRYLKVLVQNFGMIPADRPGGGHEAWLFVDEIVIK